MDWTLEYHRAEELRRGVKGVQISTAKLLRLTMGLNQKLEDHFVCLVVCFCEHLFKCIIEYPCWVLASHLQDQPTK